jgi:ubiquinone/menaquinone biosynthesis C-methylase UbiE
MNYDATDIPAGYDRGRSHGPELLDLWMTAVARHVGDRPVRTILDLGCGTGRFSDALATRFAATVIGVDPSRKMLAQARGKRARGEIVYVRGSGEAIPLRDKSTDLVFMSMVFHHFTDADTVGRECGRVSREGGFVFLRAATVEQIPAYPYINFIPATKPLLAERLNTKQQITQTFESAGFATVAVDVIVQQIAATHGEYAVKLAAGGDSILASLDARDLKEGLDALRRHAALVDPRPVAEPIDVFVFRYGSGIAQRN